MTRLGASGELVELELRGERGRALVTARDDGWHWRGEKAERFFALSSELQPVFDAPLSDRLLLRRAALPPLSQRRLEVLAVAPDRAEPSHVIVDRLDEGSGRPRYRLTDAEGRERLVEGA